MNFQLTEEDIRRRASAQSYQKGLDYYQSGAVSDPSWQSMPNGIVLMGHCEGSSAPSYSLRVELTSDGVQDAACTCPYDWGGDCKHIVALLINYLRRPAEFSERKSLAALLEGLEKDALLALLTHLVENNPDLYEEIEQALPVAKTHRPDQPVGVAAIKISPTQVSEQVYRKQIQRILEQSDDEENYDEWEESPGYLDDLGRIQQTAEQLLANGDAEGALIILRVLLEEMLDQYDGDMDYDGYVAGFIEDLGMPLAEAILSVALDDIDQRKLRIWIDKMLRQVDEDSIEKSNLVLIRVALEYSWSELPNPQTQPTGLKEDEWRLLGALQQARMNVLERQGRMEEFLKLAETLDLQRYILKLIALGQLDKAISASQRLHHESEIFSVAKKLGEVGRLTEAVALAERKLISGGTIGYELGQWLAPLEEKLGRQDIALLAYRAAYDAQPSLAAIATSSGWPALRGKNFAQRWCKKSTRGAWSYWSTSTSRNTNGMPPSTGSRKKSGATTCWQK